MEIIPCIFCAKNNDTIVIEQDGFQGRKCFDCSLIYISPRPPIGAVLDIYGHGNAHISAHSHIAGSLLKRLYARHHLRILKKYCSAGNVLEIGSGAGYFLDEARTAGFNPFGIELNPEQASFMKNTLHIPCEQKPLSNDSFAGTLFDVIYHSDVISHFHDPLKEFNTMYALLREHGYVVFETGNIADIDSRYFSLFSSFQYPDHLFFFGENTLKMLLEKTGFRLVAVHRYSIVPQLLLMRLLSYVSKTKKTAAATDRVEGIHHSKQSVSKTELKTRLKNNIKFFYYYFLLFLRYYVGAIMPKKQRPQTIIFVAQKMS